MFARILLLPDECISHSHRLSENTTRVMEENIGAVMALAYVMGGNLFERYGKKMSGSIQKIEILVFIVFKRKYHPVV